MRLTRTYIGGKRRYRRRRTRGRGTRGRGTRGRRRRPTTTSTSKTCLYKYKCTKRRGKKQRCVYTYICPPPKSKC